MPTYKYECTECGHKETAEQPFGAPREIECTECTGVSKRLVGKAKESSMIAVTPGACSEYSKENRSANRIMTKIREKNNLDPHDNQDMLAADRHQGKKNGLIPGNRGD